MTKHRIYATSVASVYPHYVTKAEKKGRTQSEVDEIFRWLTGYSQPELEAQLKARTDFETFFAEAPLLHPNRGEISAITEIQTGSNPQTLALSSDGEVAFVANRGDDSVSVVSLRGGPHGPRIAACREPFGIVSHRTLLYVTCFGDSSVAVIDPASRSRIGTIDVDIDPARANEGTGG